MYNAIIFCAGIIAAQRYTMPESYHLICIVPFLIALWYMWKSPSQACVYLMLALFYSADLGAEKYEITPPIIRYLIYASSLAALFLITKIDDSLFFIKSGILILLISTTSILHMLDSGNTIQVSGGVRDVLILLCIVLCFANTRKSAVNLRPLYLGSLGYLLAEFINMTVFFEPKVHSYMNFASLKSFIVFPLIYSLFDRNISKFGSVFLLFITMPVIFSYSSRMLIVVLIAGSVLFIPFHLKISISKIVVFVFVLILAYPIITYALAIYPEIQYNRVFVFVSEIYDFPASGSGGGLEAIDSTRVAEHRLFFSRSLGSILFGDGIGSGISDPNRMLSNVAGEVAFTIEELTNSYFFNFHDIWIDFSLRFGLVTLAFLVFSFWRLYTSAEATILLLVFLVLIINATFSISGVIFCTLFFKVVMQNMQYHRHSRSL